jgi:hypothetical protein
MFGRSKAGKIYFMLFLHCTIDTGVNYKEAQKFSFEIFPQLSAACLFITYDAKCINVPPWLVSCLTGSQYDGRKKYPFHYNFTQINCARNSGNSFYRGSNIERHLLPLQTSLY